jgi:hypothetical protein
VAANQGSKNFVAAECHDGVVIWMRIPIVVIVGAPAIIEVRLSCSTTVGLQRMEVTRRHYHAQIPEFHTLIFAVTQNVP